MARITYGDLENSIDRLVSRGGELPADVGDGGIVAYPPGTPVPTAGNRRPARSIPVGGFPLSAAEPIIDLSCYIHDQGPDSFINRALQVGSNRVTRAVGAAIMNTLCGTPPGRPVPPSTPMPPPLQSQFSGGQCICDRYFVRVRVTSQSSNSNIDRTAGNLRGPIRSFNTFYNTNTDGDVLAGGVDVVHGHPDCGGIVTTRLDGVSAFERDVQFAVLQVTNQDNPDDDCGDPAPYPPDTNPPADVPRPINFDPGGGGAPITFNPTFSFDIGLNGPVLRVGDDNVNFDFDFGGVDINFPGVGGGGAPDPCPPAAPEEYIPDPTTPVQPPPPDEPPAPPDPPEGEETIRGVYVTVSGGLGGSTQVLSVNGGAPAYFPDLGLISFRVRSPDGQLGYLPPVRVQHRQSYIEVDSVFGAVEVSSTPRPGLSFDIREVRYVAPVPT